MLQVALKIISKKALTENKEIANEVHALRELRHRNVMRMYDVIDTPNALVLVLELLDGGMGDISFLYHLLFAAMTQKRPQ
jgi:serine/threonine protein kinase